MNSRIKTTAAALSGLLAALLLAVSSARSTAAPPPPVTIDLGFTTWLSETSLTGPFAITGALETEGTYVQNFVIHDDTLHCENVLEDQYGTIILDMQCKMVFDDLGVLHGPGRWVIKGGTGRYAKLHGAGSLEMLFDGVTTTIEYLQGIAFFDNGK